MKQLAILCLILASAWRGFSEDAEKAKPEVKPYPFTFCIVQGDELDPYAEPYAAVVDGQQYRFCCKDCWEEFRKDPKPYIEKFKKLEEEAAKKAESE